MKEMSFFAPSLTLTPLALYFIYNKIETVYLYHTFQARVFYCKIKLLLNKDKFSF
jgi:hypothetical protein